jgi:hypothetical protein
VLAIVVLYLATAEGDPATTTAIAQAVERAMGGGPARVTIRSIASPSAPGLADACREPGVLGAASVSWVARPEKTATVSVRHCATSQAERFRLTFAEDDPPSERARSVGFVIASALHASAPEPNTAPREPTARVVSPEPAGEPATLPHTTSLGAFATTSLPFGGDGGGVGGGVALRSAWTDRWGGRLGLHWRTGQIPAAQASISEAGLSAGVTYALMSPGRGWLPGVGLRLDGSLLYDSIVHLSSDDPEPVQRHRFLPAADARCELTWSLGSVGLNMGAGVQAAFGVADVLVRARKVAELRPLRGVVEIGFVVGL